MILEEAGIKTEMSMEYMSINNSFLNLMETKYMDFSNIFTIAGSGIPTNAKFGVNIKDMEKNKWIDVKKIQGLETRIHMSIIEEN